MVNRRLPSRSMVIIRSLEVSLLKKNYSIATRSGQASTLKIYVFSEKLLVVTAVIVLIEVVVLI